MWQHMYFGGPNFEEPEISVSEMKIAIGLGSKLREVYNKGKVVAWCLALMSTPLKAALISMMFIGPYAFHMYAYRGEIQSE